MIKNPRTRDGVNNTIPVDIAKKMTAAFRESQQGDKGSFTEAAWFPAKQIAQLAEKVAKFDGDGVRIYFGRYTREIIESINKLEYGDKVPDSYAEMNTLLFVVTKVIDGKARTDYFAEKVGHGHGNGHKIALISAKPRYGSEPIPTDPGNRADLCPAMCDDGSELMKP
ncbi:hypothetical protein [Pedobacter sp. Leaf194]|uniref:hypothetical protein n=1 Tax=Pedobacter sp. Leaf194 TaxID=1736297 RepID=UPI0007037E0B|nr:hypothetical protein [Pedobacter sp. Leaf194]KQS41393.1 hypothetical protein ASG14_02650 [Pedobacter sp. Leaf194]RZL63350.1 MAG: hypothetical protein EOO93_07900 [Pedobacter sp.]